MTESFDELKQRLTAKDFRLTPQREAVLQTLFDNQERHLSADEIYLTTKNNYPDIGLATIYRTLDLFEALAIIRKLEFGGEGCKYEFNLDMEDHYHHHLICFKCGNIAEVSNDSLDELEREIAIKNKFVIRDHSLRFYGYCANCRDNNDKE